MKKFIIKLFFQFMLLEKLSSMMIESHSRVFSIFPSNKSNSIEQKIKLFNKAPTEAIQTYFLKDLLNSIEINKNLNKFEMKKETCEVQSIEMSLQIKDCGRVPIRATKCFGFCPSGQIFVPYKNLMRTTFSYCRATEYKYLNKKIECNDGSIKYIDLKYISECSCSNEIRKISESSIN